MDALVLSGGNIRGAYQAGAIQAVMEHGLRPGAIFGTSVGALHTGWLCAHQPLPHTGAYTWAHAGKSVADFWLREITGPDKIIDKRSFLELAWRVWRKRWDGVVDTEPLAELVRAQLARRLEDVRQLGGGITAQVTSVDLHSGRLVYTDSDEPHFLEAVMASTAEPVSMPWRTVKGLPHYDGGLMEIAPLRQAIQWGGTRIVVILTQPEAIPSRDMDRDLLHIVSRVVHLVTANTLADDLREIEKVNQQLRAVGANPPLRAALGLANKRQIEVIPVRPARGVPLDLERFTSDDIRRAVDLGQIDGAAAMMRLAA